MNDNANYLHNEYEYHSNWHDKRHNETVMELNSNFFYECTHMNNETNNGAVENTDSEYRYMAMTKKSMLSDKSSDDVQNTGYMYKSIMIILIVRAMNSNSFS